MKVIIYKALAVVFLLAAIIYQCKAQINLSANLSTQPAWGPVGYDHADYYYLPDVESYYSVTTHQFIYLNNGRWVYASALPPRYAHYDLYSGYKVVVNKPRPFLSFTQDRVQYARYQNYHNNQPIIRDSHDAKYPQRNNTSGQTKKHDHH